MPTVQFSYKTEPVSSDLVEEIEALLRDMYYNSVASTDIPMYDFDWHKYKLAEDAGILMLTTARYEELLVGFALYLIVRHPHHMTVTSAECDAIAINQNLRNNGIGKNLIDFSLDQLRGRGAKFVTHRYRTCYEAEPVFPKLGFRLIEHVYLKDL